MPDDAEVLGRVRTAFDRCGRPEDFINYTHRDECARHDGLLRSRDPDTLRMADVCNPGGMSMTEPEWLASTDLFPMLIFLRGEVEPPGREPDLRSRSIGAGGDLFAGPGSRVGPGRLARFARECCRRWWDLPLDEASATLVRSYERFLDGAGSWEGFAAAHQAAWNVPQSGTPLVRVWADDWSPTPLGVSQLTQGLAWATACHAHRDRIAELERTATEDDRFAWGFFGYDFPEFHETAATIFRPLPGLLREVVGNPFRPAVPDPAWLTEAVVGLCRAIDDDRAFDRMPILADALQDSGCDNADVLDHCRGPGPHARGCWVVDRLLGRE